MCWTWRNICSFWKWNKFKNIWPMDITMDEWSLGNLIVFKRLSVILIPDIDKVIKILTSGETFLFSFYTWLSPVDFVPNPKLVFQGHALHTFLEKDVLHNIYFFFKHWSYSVDFARLTSKVGCYTVVAGVWQSPITIK